MPLFGRDANGSDAYIRSSGAGTTADPFITFHDQFTSDLKFWAGNITGSADLIGAVSGKRIRVMSLIASADEAFRLQFQSNTTTNLTGHIYAPKNGTIAISNPLGLFQTGAGEKLNVLHAWLPTAGTTIGISIAYREV